MSLEADLLRSMRFRWRFKVRAATLPLYVLSTQCRFLVEKLGAYYRQFKDCQEIDKDTFWTWLTETQGERMSDSDKLLYAALLRNFEKPLTDEGEQFLSNRINDSDASYRLLDIAERFQNGEEIDIAEELQHVSDVHRAAQRDTERDSTEVTDPISDILEKSSSTYGLKWPFASLNEAMRPAQWGDHIIVAARPDAGKTSFLAAIAVGFAQQLRELVPDDPRCILWLNNEGPGSRVKLRLWQCALHCTLPELSDRLRAGTLSDDFNAVVDESLIRIFDIHGWTTAQVERLIERVRPAVIIWDMSDHIRYTGEAKLAASRTDEYLENLYNWIREAGVRHKVVNINSTQLPGDADNIAYPLLGQLKDSKTGKQGTADAIITIGFVDVKPLVRSIGLTKNKLTMGKGASRRLGELCFDGARGYFYLPKEVEE